MPRHLMIAVAFLALVVGLSLGRAGDGPTLEAAPFATPAPGTIGVFRQHDGAETRMRFEGADGFFVTATRLGDAPERRTSLRFCWGCRPDGYRIEVEKYAAIWPLEVGKKVSFKRFSKTNDGMWIHTLRVTGTERLSTAFGEIDTFVVEQKVRGTHRNKWRGQSRHWYAPALGGTYRSEWSDNQGRRGSRELIQIIPPN